MMYEDHWDKKAKALVGTSPALVLLRGAVAEALRDAYLVGNADGSAEGTATAEELISTADYIKVRLDNWGPTPLVCDSHSAFRLFLSLVLSETADFVKGLRA